MTHAFIGKVKKNCKSEQKRQNDHKILELDNSL